MARFRHRFGDISAKKGYPEPQTPHDAVADDEPITEDTIRAWCTPEQTLQTSAILAIEHTRRLLRLVVDGHAASVEPRMLEVIEATMSDVLEELRVAIGKLT